MIHLLDSYLHILAFTWALLVLVSLFVFRFKTLDAAIFATIQTIGGVSYAPLVVLGLFVVAILSYFYAWTPVGPKFQWKGGRLTWLWGNEIDGIVGPGMSLNRLNAFNWCAIRNSCNNLRFVPGVSKVGRPLWYRTFTIFGREFYAKAGWESTGYPALSAGSGRGY